MTPVRRLCVAAEPLGPLPRCGGNAPAPPARSGRADNRLGASARRAYVLVPSLPCGRLATAVHAWAAGDSGECNGEPPPVDGADRLRRGGPGPLPGPDRTAEEMDRRLPAARYDRARGPSVRALVRRIRPARVGTRRGMGSAGRLPDARRTAPVRRVPREYGHQAADQDRPRPRRSLPARCRRGRADHPGRRPGRLRRPPHVRRVDRPGPDR